jgi:serine/alanine adding enzyme
MKDILENTRIIEDYSTVSIEKWERLLQATSNRTPFQSPRIYSFLKQLENIDTFLVFIEKDNEYMAGAVGFIQSEKGVSAYFSRRAIIEGGILLKDDSNEEEYAGIIADKLIRILNNKAIYLEIRNYNNYEQVKPVFMGMGFQYLPYLNIQVDCQDLESMKNRINSGKLRQIKKSLKEGAEIITADNEGQVREFYNLLRDLYKNKVKKPLPGWDFFAAFFRSKAGVYLLVTQNNEVLGGIMCPYDENSIFEWFIAGREVNDKKIYPGVLATWAAMEFASEHGIPRFDFMGAGTPDKGYGVREFKAQFGGELVEHGRFLYIFNPLLYNFGKMGLFLLSKLK